MIYKRYDLSQSLNGNNIIHIARNAAGMVIFRETSENQLKKTIDHYLKHRLEEEQAAAAKAAEKLAKKNQKRKLFSAEVKPEIEVAVKKPAPAPTRLTKTPDGKFISKSSLEKAEPPKKKHFWG